MMDYYYNYSTITQWFNVMANVNVTDSVYFQDALFSDR